MLYGDQSDTIENVLYITSRSIWYRREFSCSSVHIQKKIKTPQSSDLGRTVLNMVISPVTIKLHLLASWRLFNSPERLCSIE